MASSTTLDARQLAGYLHRIKLDHQRLAQPCPALPNLANLQWKQLQNVPFENLSLKVDKARSKPISAHLPDIYSKLVEAKLGGYCFEVWPVITIFVSHMCLCNT
jgi:arylamine N-acetyltransferase